LADYHKHYDEIRAAGAEVVAVSVDSPQKSEVVRRQLQLPFAILCDTERKVVRDWDIFNQREKGGIAKPAVFIIDRGRIVRFVSIDTVASRVPATDILGLLQSGAVSVAGRRAFYFPRISDFARAIRNGIRFGIR